MGMTQTEEPHSLSVAENSPVTNFYNGRSVFVTGATGFLGTALLEKLLSSCAGIQNIYFLIKQKDGQSIEEKATFFFNSRAFQRLREHKPDAMKKLIPIGGDLLKPSIGLSEKDIETLRDEVSIVFHSAANTSFDMCLSEAVNTNTKATGELLEMCKGMRQLVAFVHVSTAYSNSNRLIIDEKIYPCDAPPKTVYELLEHSSNAELTEYLLNSRPNTYTYSKALAEELVQSYGSAMPSVIVRPSIITASVRDPTPGWISGWGGGLGRVIYAGINGYLRCWHADSSCVLDTIPVDYVANLMIVSAWETNVRRIRGEKEVKVFNCCSGLQNSINSGTFMATCIEHNEKHAVDKKKTNKLFLIYKNIYLYYGMFVILQLIPAVTLDFISLIIGRKMIMIKNLKKLHRLSSALEHFKFKQFLFIDNNVRKLYQSLHGTDRDTFNFDVKNIKWREHIENYIIGMNDLSSN